MSGPPADSLIQSSFAWKSAQRGSAGEGERELLAPVIPGHVLLGFSLDRRNFRGAPLLHPSAKPVSQYTLGVR